MEAGTPTILTGVLWYSPVPPADERIVPLIRLQPINFPHFPIEYSLIFLLIDDILV
jgi:hypothetical protein